MAMSGKRFELENNAAGGAGRSVAQFSGACVAAVGCLILFGWALNIRPLQCIGTGVQPIKPNIGAIAFLCGSSLILISGRHVSKAARFCAVTFATLVSSLAFFTLVEGIFGLDVGIDSLLGVRSEE